MSGITHLYDLYNKKGDAFIEKLFNAYVTINEKMDGSAFVFERDIDTGEFMFYKRDQKNPITLVDRTLMKYYEKPINYIKTLPYSIINKIPRGWRFGFEYFNDKSPIEISYDELPKNNLILSYIHKKENNIDKPIESIDKLNEWADLLDVQRPPIIFQGYLSTDQKDKIIDFLRTPFNDLLKEFKTKSFVKFIISTLNSKLEKTALNDDIEKAIEGVVFKFVDKDDDGKIVSAKMVDPIFTERSKNKAKNKEKNKPSDFLAITIMDIMNFILEKGIEFFTIEGESNDERYISFINSVFVDFLDECSDKYQNVNFEEPEYLKKDEFRLNRDLINDRKVIRYLEDNESFESLYKLILNSFRKIKKRSNDIITDDVIEQFNILVKNIEKYLNSKNKKIDESQLQTFIDFKRKNIKNINYITEENHEDEEEGSNKSFNNFISALETIDNSKKPNIKNKEEDIEESDLIQINLLIGRFQPFHNGHLKMAKLMKEKNNLNSICAIVHPGHNNSGNSPFEIDIVKKYMKSLSNDELLIDGYFIVNKGLLGIIYGKAKELGYRINLIAAGEDRFDDYSKQAKYLKQAGGDFPENIEIFKTPRTIHGTDIRKQIKNEDYSSFKKMVPPSIKSFYDIFNSILNNKNKKQNNDEK